MEIILSAMTHSDSLCAGRMTQKCDIYAFGIVLLELLSGKQPVNSSSSSPDSKFLVHEFRDLLEQWKLDALMVRLAWPLLLRKFTSFSKLTCIL